MSELRRVETRRDSDEQMGWAIVGDKGAIEFWFVKDKWLRRPGFSEKIGGVETHQREPFDYSLDPESPDHDNCALLDGHCWHDGTSLWASEHWIPMYEACGEDWVWARLEEVYRERWPE